MLDGSNDTTHVRMCLLRFCLYSASLTGVASQINDGCHLEKSINCNIFPTD